MKDLFKLISILLLAPAVAFLTIYLLGGAAPIVFLMFFAMCFIIGPLLRLLVLRFPQLLHDPAKIDQLAPWGQFFGASLTAVLRAGAVLAIFRLLLTLGGRLGIPHYAQVHAWFGPGADLFFGICGLLYAFLSFVQEGLWRYRQVLAVRDLATSTVASAAVGLVELTGTVWLQGDRSGPDGPLREVMRFYWQFLGTQCMGGTIFLGTYDKVLQPFYLKDETGRILVDPVHDDVELRRPLSSVFTAFFGRRSFEIVLTRDVRKPSWDQRYYYLREGDRVHVIGSAEMNESASRDAVGTDRLVVRPRKEGRSGFESLLQFLAPFRRVPSRTVHDIFLIADTAEAEAKDLLKRNFLLSIGLSVLLAALSAALIIFSGAQ